MAAAAKDRSLYISEYAAAEVDPDMSVLNIKSSNCFQQFLKMSLEQKMPLHMSGAVCLLQLKDDVSRKQTSGILDNMKAV